MVCFFSLLGSWQALTPHLDSFAILDPFRNITCAFITVIYGLYSLITRIQHRTTRLTCVLRVVIHVFTSALVSSIKVHSIASHRTRISCRHSSAAKGFTPEAVDQILARSSASCFLPTGRLLVTLLLQLP